MNDMKIKHNRIYLIYSFDTFYLMNENIGEYVNKYPTSG